MGGWLFEWRRRLAEGAGRVAAISEQRTAGRLRSHTNGFVPQRHAISHAHMGSSEINCRCSWLMQRRRRKAWHITDVDRDRAHSHFMAIQLQACGSEIRVESECECMREKERERVRDGNNGGRERAQALPAALSAVD